MNTKNTTPVSRWCFTDHELRNPVLFASCRATDEFFATGADPDGIGVIVYRDGSVSNRYADGTAGVTDEDRAEADADESPYDFRNNDIADNWKNVEVQKDGSPVLG